MERLRQTNNLRVVHSASELATALRKGYVGSSGQCKACCPAHEDVNPSLSIYDGSNGNILLYCHSGCSYDRIINALKTEGISLNNKARFERYPGLPDGISYKFDGKDYVAHYEYKDEKGKTVGYTVRYESGSGEKVIIPYFKYNSGKLCAGHKNKTVP